MTYNTLSHPYRTQHNNTVSHPPMTLMDNHPHSHSMSSTHMSYFGTASAGDRKAHEAAKARKIKEYLGIAANISDWDFEALQSDIQALGETLLAEVGSPSITQPAEKNQMDTDEPEDKRDSADILHEPEPLPSDTDSDQESEAIEEDEEMQMLHKYEKEQYSLAWRWYWLQLQVSDLQFHITQCDNEVEELRKNKESCLPPPKGFETNWARRVGWKKLQRNRDLLPPNSSAIHLRLGNSFHPLFAKKPRKFTLPQQPKTEAAPVVPDSLPVPEPISPRRPNRNRNSTPTSRRSPSRRNSELTSSQPCRSLSRRNDYDIDDIVLPMMTGTVRKIRKIEYKEILTPRYREIDDSLDVPMSDATNDSSDENTSDEIYSNRHAPKEQEERNRFVLPQQKKATEEAVHNNITSDTRQTISTVEKKREISSSTQ